MQTLESRRVLASIVVTTLADEVIDDDLISLREAVTTANDTSGTDEISFDASLFGDPSDAPAEIDLVLGQFEVTESLNLLGPGADLLTLDGQFASRVLGFSADTGDLTIQGVSVVRGSSTLNDNPLFTASGGGLRFAADGTLTLRDVVMRDNSVSGRGSGGGAIFVSGNLAISDSSLSSNNATHADNPRGGAIFATGGSVSLANTSVSLNVAAGQGSIGGGLYVTPTVETSLTIIGSEIAENLSQGINASAGGIGIQGRLAMYNSTVSGNEALPESVGGGISIIDASSDTQSHIIVNSTIVDNEATDGGGIHLSSSSNDVVEVNNTILASNSGSLGGPDLGGETDQFNFQGSLIGDNRGTSLAESQTPDANGNLVGSVLGSGVIDPQLNELGFNAGTTRSHEPQSGSPAIGAGISFLANDVNGVPLTSDQRGLPFVRQSDTVDIGSFEVQAPITPEITWPTPTPIIVGTAISGTQLNATSTANGSFIYQPSAGTVLPQGNGQQLTATFTPADGRFYTSASADVLIDVIAQPDYGDAPDSYSTLASSGGPAHASSTLILGSEFDVEPVAQASVDATGDGDDEDGIQFLTPIIADSIAPATASISVSASRSGKLDAWIDFNGNGTFDPLTEHLGGGTSLDVTTGNNLIAFSIPTDAVAGDTFARFRLSSAGDLLPTGSAADGEVEDYAVTILDSATPISIDLDLIGSRTTVAGQSHQVVITVDGLERFRAPLTAVNDYQLTLDNLSNLFIVDSTNGQAIPTGGLSLDGGGRSRYGSICRSHRSSRHHV